MTADEDDTVSVVMPLDHDDRGSRGHDPSPTSTMPVNKTSDRSKRWHLRTERRSRQFRIDRRATARRTVFRWGLLSVRRKGGEHAVSRMSIRTCTWRLRRKVTPMSTNCGAKRSSFVKPTPLETIYALSPFVPKLLQKEIVETCSSGRQTEYGFQPSMQIIRGAVMVADVSGFTRLTEQLGREGHAGIELLTLVINNYLTKAIDIVLEYGGDVIKFAGDSLVVAFYGNPTVGTGISLEAMNRIVSRAVHCAEELSAALGRVQMMPNGDIRPMKRTKASLSILETALRRRVSRKSRTREDVRNPHATDRSTLRMRSTHASPKNSSESRPKNVDNCSFRCSIASIWRLRGSERKTSSTTRSSASTPLSPDTPDNSEHVVTCGNIRSSDSRAFKSPSVFKNVLASGEMHLKVLVGCGDYCMFRVGGGAKGSKSPRWEYIIADQPNKTSTYVYGHLFRQPLKQLAAIEEFAEEGDIILSEETMRMVEHGFEYESLDGAVRLMSYVLRPHSRTGVDTLGSSQLTSAPCALRSSYTEVLRMFVMDNVRQKIELGHLEYISEIRRLSVLFFGFPGLSVPDKEMEQRPLENTQFVTAVLQEWMDHFEGSLVQLRCDEKGFLAICAFGLTGSYHPDNASRAIKAAIRVVSVLRQASIDTCAGVTTGDLLCACIGALHRSEYTLFGNAINLSARLMCKAKRGMGSILCDATTREQSKRSAQFHPMEEVRIKGLEQPMRIYLVTEIEICEESNSDTESMSLKSMIGRRDEFSAILEWLQASTAETSGGVLIEGPAGIGKTVFLSAVETAFRRDSTKLICHSSTDVDSSSKFLHPWRTIFQNLILYERQSRRVSSGEASGSAASLEQILVGSSRFGDPGSKDFVAECLGAEETNCLSSQCTPTATSSRNIQSFDTGDLSDENSLPCCSREVVPELGERPDSSGIGSFLVEDRYSTKHVATVKGEAVVDLLVTIFQLFVEIYTPVVVILDNLQHFDDLSLDLLEAIVKKVHSGLQIIAAKRPVLLSEKDRGARPVQVSWLRVLVIEPLSFNETCHLVESIADGFPISDAVARHVYIKSGGIPLYIEQMSRYLKEQDRLDTRTMEQELLLDDGLMKYLREHGTVHHALLKKLDRLDPTTHLTLKVAVVIGKQMDVQLLERVYPYSVSHQVLSQGLEELTNIGLLNNDGMSKIWNFGSLLERDALYDTIPLTQCRSLHIRAASVMETNKCIPCHPETVAYHWTQSCLGVEHLETDRLLKAIQWWSVSADDAYAKAADLEALRHFQKAKELTRVYCGCAKKENRRGSCVRLTERSQVSNEETTDFVPTSLIKAGWQRHMATICHRLMSKATTSDERLKMMQESVHHVIEGLKQLKIPLPQIYRFAATECITCESRFPKFGWKRMDAKRQEEISQLLNVLSKSGKQFDPYIAVIKRRFLSRRRRT